MDRGNKGAYNELLATTWLLQNGYYVFRNVSPHGLVDLIAMKDNQLILIDVKASNIYNGKYMGRTLTDDQISLGVKVLTVYDDGKCMLDLIPKVQTPKTQRICQQCSKAFETNRKKHKFCSPKCRMAHFQTK
jgi:hypothetical protein